MRLVINALLFQAGWFLSVLGAANGLPWLGPLAAAIVIAYHLQLAREPRIEAQLIVACGVVGAAFDSVLVASGWVSYPSGMLLPAAAPYWIVTMWLLFATTLNVSLRWLHERPAIASVLGGVAGPASYYAGYRLGGIEFVAPAAALLFLAAGWALLMPLVVSLARRLDGIELARSGGRA